MESISPCRARSRCRRWRRVWYEFLRPSKAGRCICSNESRLSRALQEGTRPSSLARSSWKALCQFISGCHFGRELYPQGGENMSPSALKVVARVVGLISASSEERRILPRKLQSSESGESGGLVLGGQVYPKIRLHPSATPEIVECEGILVRHNWLPSVITHNGATPTRSRSQFDFERQDLHVAVPLRQ